MNWHRIIVCEHYDQYCWMHVGTIDKGKPRGAIVVSGKDGFTFMSPDTAREYATALNEAADYVELENQ